MRKVFVSSTARDLTAYREAAYRAIERLDGFHGVRMEDFGARDAESDEFCRAKIAECDVAVFIVGLCHGSSPKGFKTSYTEREYQAAKDADLPRLAFLSEEGKFYDGYYRESDARWKQQQAFRARLNGERMRDTFATPEELSGKVAAAIGNWARDHRETRPGSGKVLEAEVRGPGAIAQGIGAVAAGAGGVAVGGNMYGNLSVGAARSDETPEFTLREAYLNRIMARYGYLSLAGIDPAVAGQSDTDTRLNLNAVYTALLTQSPRHEESGRGAQDALLPHEENRRSALEQLDRHRWLVLQGDPGSGKSTFVNFVALCLAGEGKKDPQVNLKRLTTPLPGENGEDGEEPQPWRYDALLPVPVVLRDFAATALPKGS